jgi:hypothetical protein
MRFDSVYNFCLKHISFYEELSEILPYMYTRPHMKYTLSSSYFNDINFLNKFSKNTQISNFTKIRVVGAEANHADGWTDLIKLTVAFS